MYSQKSRETVRYAAGSSFRSSEANAFDKVALSEEEEQGDRHDDDGRRGHQQVPLRGVEPGEFGQPERQCVFVRIVQVDERIQKIVPSRQAGKDRDRCERGAAERQDDMTQHLERIGAVEYRGLIQLARNGEKELPQQKDEEDIRSEPVREHQRPVRVDEMKTGPEQKRRNEGGDEGEHEGQKQEPEDQVPSRPR